MALCGDFGGANTNFSSPSLTDGDCSILRYGDEAYANPPSAYELGLQSVYGVWALPPARGSPTIAALLPDDPAEFDSVDILSHAPEQETVTMPPMDTASNYALKGGMVESEPKQERTR